MASIMFEMSSSSVIPTFPTATPKHSTFFNWNLIVDLTSVILEAKSSLCEMGVGNLPAGVWFSKMTTMSGIAPMTYPWRDQDPRGGGSA